MKWQTFNIKYCLYESYLFKRFILAYIQITKLVKENYLQRNLILQNCLHRVNMWCGYYMATDLSEVLDPALCGGGQYQVWSLTFLLVFIFYDTF